MKLIFLQIKWVTLHKKNMKVALLQLSDIHIKSENDFIIRHQEEFYRSCKSFINECTKLIVIITGDIAFSGSDNEYAIAYKWLKQCEDAWRKEANFLNSVEYIIVPGNHDCDFSKQLDVRNLLIKTVSREDTIESDDVISTCLAVQSNFWSFYGKLRNTDLTPRISWIHDVKLKQDLSIVFNCYNSASLSQLNEQPGELIIPQNKFLERVNRHPQDIVISLFHHNTGWLSPNTSSNNKKLFEEHLFATSNIVMCGHEHSEQYKKVSSLSDYQELAYMENAAFQCGKDSEYGLVIFDTDDMNFTGHQFKYANNAYQESKECTSFSILKKQSGIQLTTTWREELETINIPLKHIHKQNLHLSDIFVFPDLDPLSDIKSKCIHYIDSKELLSTSISERVIVLEGENQSGKSSLLQQLYSTWYKKGIYPIMLPGKIIKHHNVSNQLKSSYKEQYQHKSYSYEQYMQLDKSKRIILIDDFDESIINSDSKSKLLEGLLCNFEKIVVTTDLQIDLRSILLHLNNTDNLKHFRILSLGYSKRNDLIEKWIRLGQDTITLNEEMLLTQVKQAYDNISVLLGQQLIPSYPVFILSLLQGLNQVFDNFDISKTSYAFCYNSLIIASLLKSGTDKEKINGVLKFLSEFAYHLFKQQRNRKYFDNNDFEKFYSVYKKDYNASYSAEVLLKNLCNADIIRRADESCYSFSYKYIFYFLVAQKISQLVNDNQENGIVQELCMNLHKEREANILIFLVYHNGTEKQMEDLLFASMLPFESYKPITLNIDDPLFAGINDIVDGIKTDVMLQNIDPHENRNIALRESDDIRRKLDIENQEHQPSEKDFEENDCLRDLNNTFKIIKILGQIIKNQMETLKKDQIQKLIEESYNVCFRSISFFCNLIENSKEEIIQYLLDKYKNRTNIKESELRTRVHKLLHMLLYHQCLNSFTNLARAVGTSNVPYIYDEIAKRFGTPAAKIISFTINTYYNKLRIKDLEELLLEYKNNPVVMEIIKARVLHYVYNNYIELSQRQKIGQLCGLKLINNTEITTKSKYSKNYGNIIM